MSDAVTGSASIQFGTTLQEFMQKLMSDEGIPKDIRERSYCTFIYIRNYMVDQVCFVSTKPNTFKRFVKGTEFKIENKRIWIKPKKQYLVTLGDVKLDEKKLYIIQLKPNYEFRAYIAYDPGEKMPRKGVFERKPV